MDTETYQGFPPISQGVPDASPELETAASLQLVVIPPIYFRVAYRAKIGIGPAEFYPCHKPIALTQSQEIVTIWTAEQRPSGDAAFGRDGRALDKAAKLRLQ
jgi:hypothetical protein